MDILLDGTRDETSKEQLDAKSFELEFIMITPSLELDKFFYPWTGGGQRIFPRRNRSVTCRTITTVRKIGGVDGCWRQRSSDN